MLTCAQDRRRIERWLSKQGFNEAMEVDGAGEKKKRVIKNIGRVIFRLGGRGSMGRRDETSVVYWLWRFDFDAMVATKFNPEHYRRWTMRSGGRKPEGRCGGEIV